MLSKKSRFVLTFIIMTAIELMVIGQNEIVAGFVSIIFVISYITMMIRVLRDEPKDEKKATVSPQLKLKTKAPF